MPETNNKEQQEKTKPKGFSITEMLDSMALQFDDSSNQN